MPKAWFGQEQMSMIKTECFIYRLGPYGRQSLKLFLSTDEGINWTEAKVILGANNPQP